MPPDSYGGIEWVVALLCDELVARGHEVTLFASGDSQTAARLRHVYDVGETEKMGQSLPDALHVSAALQSAHEFDIIHDHSGFLGVAFSSFVETPMLHTLHGPFTEDMKMFYGVFADSCFYNAISEHQRSCMPTLRYVDTVHNAIDVNSYPWASDKDDFAVLVSRICPDKGTHLAVEATRRAGIKLVLAGKIDPGPDREYFEHAIQPHVDGRRVTFLGEISESEKRRLMAKARCFVFPIQWPEPFGLVMAEAMAAGTPVVAIGEGSVPEVVVDGVTGFVVDGLDGMVARLGEVDRIDPAACRAHAERNFSPARMASDYERNYERILGETQVTSLRARQARTTIQGGMSNAALARSKSEDCAERGGNASGIGGDRDRHRRYDIPDGTKTG